MKPTAIKRYLIPLILLFVLVVAAVIGLGLLHRSLQSDDHTTTIFPDQPDDASDQSAAAPNPDTTDQPTTPVLIDFQPLLDQWVADTRGSSQIDLGVMIYDLDHQTVVGSYQPDTVFNSASIYKLFYAYDGYREIAAGRDSADAYFITTADNSTGNTPTSPPTNGRPSKTLCSTNRPPPTTGVRVSPPVSPPQKFTTKSAGPGTAPIGPSITTPPSLSSPNSTATISL